MKQATPIPKPHAHQPPPERNTPEGAFLALRQWLKHFALYLGMVTVAFATGIYFLWQLPAIQDVQQFLRNTEEVPTAKPAYRLAANPATATKPVEAAKPEPVPAPAPITVEPDNNPAAPPTDAVQVTDATAPAADTSTATDAATPAAQTATPSPEPAPAPVPEPQQTVDQLLADARQQMDNRRLTAPANANALSSYRRVLELQPNNPVALDGIQRIAAYYRGAAEQSLRRGQADESLGYIRRGLSATPDDSTLIELRKAAQLAKQRAREEQRAQMEELQRQQIEQQQRQEETRRAAQETRQAPSWWQQPPQYENSGGFNQR
jgi:tetratricopeptide (TPR) repeat protein